MISEFFQIKMQKSDQHKKCAGFNLFSHNSTIRQTSISRHAKRPTIYFFRIIVKAQQSFVETTLLRARQV